MAIQRRQLIRAAAAASLGAAALPVLSQAATKVKVGYLHTPAVDGQMTHAWLFTGPPGIGKLHTARVFAAALNCPAGGDGTCDTCRRILRGVHPDVHVIVPEGAQIGLDLDRDAEPRQARHDFAGRGVDMVRLFVAQVKKNGLSAELL